MDIRICITQHGKSTRLQQNLKKSKLKNDIHHRKLGSYGERVVEEFGAPGLGSTPQIRFQTQLPFSSACSLGLTIHQNDETHLFSPQLHAY